MVQALTNDYGLLTEPVTLTVDGGGTNRPSGNTGGTTLKPGETVEVLINGQKVTATVGADGVLQLVYTESDIAKYADGSGTCTFKIGGHENLSLSIPTASMGNDDLVIETDFGTLTIPNAVLKKLGGTLRLKISKSSFAVALVDEKGKEIPYNDPANPLRLTLPYTLNSGQKAEAVVAVTKAGTVMPYGVYKNGSVTFDIPATGTYDVIYGLKMFPDVAGHWGIEYINFVGARSLYQGNEQGAFMPDGSMTRAMFTQVLANLEQVDLTKYKTSRFTDVPAAEWYAPAVEWAADKGIVAGVGGNKFAPNDSITREQMAVMLNNYISKRGFDLIPTNGQVAFADENTISLWALEGVKAIQAYGIIRGKPGNIYDPKNTATRAEVATIFARFIETAAP